MSLGGGTRDQAPLLTSALADSQVLARHGDRRIWVLDPAAAALWALYASGLDERALADLLQERFALPAKTARRQVAAVLEDWRHAGLLPAGEPPAEFRDDIPGAPSVPLAPPVQAILGAERVWIGDRTVYLGCDDPTIGHLLQTLLAMSPAPAPPAEAVAHHLQVHGTIGAWQLRRDNQGLDAGTGSDAALLSVLQALRAIGCRPSERLLVLHAAGLVAPDGQGLLLIAPGGSGKTTLAAALNAAGFALLSDDVVPVTLAGDLLGLNLPLCLKPGSWPVLTPCRPDLEQAPPVERFGQRVRFVPARGPAVARPVRPVCLLFPRYAPEEAACMAPLSPVQALQGILGAEAVLRDLTQVKLDGLARWIETLPAFALTYPDLATGLEQVAACHEAVAGARP